MPTPPSSCQTGHVQSYQAHACGPSCLVELPAVGLLAVFVLLLFVFSLCGSAVGQLEIAQQCYTTAEQY